MTTGHEVSVIALGGSWLDVREDVNFLSSSKSKVFALGYVLKTAYLGED